MWSVILSNAKDLTMEFTKKYCEMFHFVQHDD